MLQVKKDPCLNQIQNINLFLIRLFSVDLVKKLVEEAFLIFAFRTIMKLAQELFAVNLIIIHDIR